jgi:hypothetical protein
MKRINKSTLDFINNNIKINTSSSSFPLRQPYSKTTTSATATVPTSLSPAITLPPSKPAKRS